MAKIPIAAMVPTVPVTTTALVALGTIVKAHAAGGLSSTRHRCRSLDSVPAAT